MLLDAVIRHRTENLPCEPVFECRARRSWRRIALADMAATCRLAVGGTWPVRRFSPVRKWISLTQQAGTPQA
jgi:hypothetical protein